jgi:polyisoprenoid-binding protein YceI
MFGLNAQPVYLTRTGKILFFSETPLEDVKAVNNKVYSSLNIQTRLLQFLVTIKNFEFKRDAMQRHFNDEDYMHSEKYPTASFKGTILNRETIDFSKNGKVTAQIEGELNMHGVTKMVKTTAIFLVQNGKIDASATFNVRLEDYKIKVPKIVFKKIAEEIKIDVVCQYQTQNSH